MYEAMKNAVGQKHGLQPGVGCRCAHAEHNAEHAVDAFGRHHEICQGAAELLVLSHTPAARPHRPLPALPPQGDCLPDMSSFALCIASLTGILPPIAGAADSCSAQKSVLLYVLLSVASTEQSEWLIADMGCIPDRMLPVKPGHLCCLLADSNSTVRFVP